MENDEEKTAIRNKIITNEKRISALTSKYLELQKKLNTNTTARNEFKPLLDEILNELDIIIINTLKARNIEFLKEKEKNFYLEEKQKISNNINKIKEEIIKKKKELYEAKKHREYLIKCEDMAKEINKYSPPKILNQKIDEIKEENDNIIKKRDELDKNLNDGNKNINKIIEIISGLKKSFVDNNNNNNFGNKINT